MKRIFAVLMLLCVLCMLFLAACGASTPPAPTGDEAGGWIPSPIGSGTCVAKGIPNIPDGTKAQCQLGPLAPGEPGYWQPIGNGTCVAHGITGLRDGTQAPCREVMPRTPASATPAAKPTATPTTAPSGPVVTHGRPRLGGPLSDFAGKYGAMDSNGNVWDSGQTILVAPRATGANVVRVTVSGPDNWDDPATQNYCEQYLPDGASQFNRTPGADPVFIDYHSSLGEIVMQLASPTCLLFVQGS